LLEGHIEGKRGRGRKRRDWVKDIELCTQDNYVTVLRKLTTGPYGELWSSTFVSRRRHAEWM